MRLSISILTSTAATVFFLIYINICYSLFIYDLFIFLFDCARSSLLGMGFSLLVTSRGYSLVAVHRLLIAAAFLVADHGSRREGSRGWAQ